MASLVYRIPCCGGFCAPTVNPEESCLKHVSNEWTLPASGVYLKASPVIESNLVCRSCGRLGVQATQEFRRPLMVAGSLVNFVGCILSIFAAIGMASSYGGLVFGHWVYGEITVDDWPLKMYLGVSSRVFAVECASDGCISFATGADFTDEGSNIYAKEQDDETCSNSFGSAAITSMCEECKDNQFSESTLILGVITYWPTILTNFQRSTEFGDVNCQKFLGIFTNVLGFFTSLSALSAYADACYSSLPTSVDIVIAGDNAYAGTADISWSMGGCFGCLIAATFLRLIDLAIHIVVPTPPARHEPMKSDVKEITDYLAEANEALDEA
jgi:hypothetical protein